MGRVVNTNVIRKNKSIPRNATLSYNKISFSTSASPFLQLGGPLQDLAYANARGQSGKHAGPQ